MGGLIAAGLASIFGIGALASVLGFLLQFALIAGIVLLIAASSGSRNQPPRRGHRRAGLGRRWRVTAMMRESVDRGSAVPPWAAAQLRSGARRCRSARRISTLREAARRDPARLQARNIDKLGELTTPEMLSYFAQDLSDNAKQGVRNEISDVKLLQGDIAEAWQEGGSDYATVAMRYALIDAIVNKATGKVVSGDRRGRRK